MLPTHSRTTQSIPGTMQVTKDLLPGHSPQASESRVHAWLRTQCEASDKAPFEPFYLATIVYALLVTIWAFRPLWMDELSTYYVARTPHLRDFVTASLKLDFNPPLQAALTALSLRVFGDSPFSTRLPSVIAFWIASACIYRFVGFRLGRYYGLAAVLAFWTTDFLRYGAEARPYAIMIASLGIVMVCWQRMYESKRRWIEILGILVGTGGLFASHAFGPLLLLPLGVAELVRSSERKKIDWWIWLAFVIPSPLLAFYLPMFNNYGQVAIVYPPAFQASLATALGFYSYILSAGSVTFLVAFVASLMVGKNEGETTGEKLPGYQRHELIFLVGLLFVPFVINFFLMKYGAAFWPRYGIGAGIGIGSLFAYVLAKATRSSLPAAAIAAAVLLIGLITTKLVYPLLLQPATNITKELSVEDIPGDLPIVAASGVTFLEMNHREGDALLSRSYYLTDPIAAKRYANATLFENYFSRQNLFPIRGHIVPYRTFIGSSPHFLVLCTPGYPEDWLVQKLLADGANLRFLGEMDRGYRDRTVFEVTIAKTSSN